MVHKMNEYEQLNELIKIMENKSKDMTLVDEIKEDAQKGDYSIALEKINRFFEENDEKTEDKNKDENNKENEDEDEVKDEDEEEKIENDFQNKDLRSKIPSFYPEKLRNFELEKSFIGMLLKNPKLMAKYYITRDECYFDNKILLEIYKGVVFTEGEAYTPYVVKEGFNFGENNFTINTAKKELIEEYKYKNIDMEQVYLDLKKLFVLRKYYNSMPIKSIQESIIEIIDYSLYNQMSENEVESAVNQVMVTDKFKQSILSEGLKEFFEKGDNNLRNGLNLPFRIISSAFKGIRRGETNAWAMPSNAGKSRFTINIVAYLALVHKKKTLVISNEMSEEKMKLCLITTILNNESYQKMHGKKLKKSEGELLEFKFRPDNKHDVKIDEDGYVVKLPDESQQDFVKRLEQISSEYRDTIEAMDWVKSQIENQIYFVNITDHTNDELKKIVMNYYYKYDIHYMFYDTLKTDTENIGNGEEIKRTATILSNLAQNFNLFIGSTLQLRETSTLPVNLTINDLAVSGTVKEVLDSLCLIKQINRRNLKEYEYSLKEVDTEYFDLENINDPDVRYYACVVDKNRAGAKPTVVFRLNLAYNHWEELGYLRLKEVK